jgi:hypothetical protein
MGTVILRSFCCGVAGAVASVPVYCVALICWALRNTPPAPRGETGGGEVGWDLLTMFHNVGSGVVAGWFLAAFAIGFALGFRYFSKRNSPQTL